MRLWNLASASHCSYQGPRASLQPDTSCLSHPPFQPHVLPPALPATLALFTLDVLFVRILGSFLMSFYLPGLSFPCIADSFLAFRSSCLEQLLHREAAFLDHNQLMRAVPQPSQPYSFFMWIFWMVLCTPWPVHVLLICMSLFSPTRTECFLSDEGFSAVLTTQFPGYRQVKKWVFRKYY